MAAGILLLMTVLLRERPPRWVEWQDRSFSVGEGKRAVLEKRTLKIFSDTDPKQVLWQSEKNWQVQDAFTADLDLDGESEVGVLLWKIGRYGEHRPYWVTEDETVYSQHIFIYDVVSPSGETDAAERVLKPIWFASDIGREVHSLSLITGGDIPVVALTDGQGEVTHWIWRSFGLKNVEVRAEEIVPTE